jgi:predicted nucleic acid-binding protein
LDNCAYNRHFAGNAQEIVTENQTIVDTANHYMRGGLGPMDSLHLASAVYAGVDYFITTDDPLLRCNADNITIISPVDFVFRWTKGVIHD